MLKIINPMKQKTKPFLGQYQPKYDLVRKSTTVCTIRNKMKEKSMNEKMNEEE